MLPAAFSLVLPNAIRVYALLRNASRADEWRAAGANPLLADLDDRASLQRLPAWPTSCCIWRHRPAKGGATRAPATCWPLWARAKVYHAA
jgi:hypothetical protein